MNHELNDLLKSVFREALEPINQHLKRLENKMQNNMEIMRDETKYIKENMATKYDIQALNKRVFKVESEIERLTRL